MQFDVRAHKEGVNIPAEIDICIEAFDVTPIWDDDRHPVLVKFRFEEIASFLRGSPGASKSAISFSYESGSSRNRAFFCVLHAGDIWELPSFRLPKCFTSAAPRLLPRETSMIHSIRR